MKELANAQERLKVIDRLTNSLQAIEDVNTKNDIAYFIHSLCENMTQSMTTDEYRRVAHYSIVAHDDMFMTV